MQIFWKILFENRKKEISEKTKNAKVASVNAEIKTDFLKVSGGQFSIFQLF